MRKLFSIIAATLFAGSMFATDVTVDLSKGKYENSAITWTAADGNITIQQIKGVGAAINSNYISAPRVYKGNVLAFKCEENYTITGIELTCNSTYYGGSMTAGTTIKGDTLVVDDATNILRTWASTSGGTHVVSTKNTDGESTIYIQNGPSSSTQLRFTALKISYIKAASTTPTITAGNVEFGTVVSGKVAPAKVNVTGENLSGAITYQLHSGVAFSVEGTLTATGGELTVNVIMEAEGIYEDVLTLTSGTEASKEITITANVVELSGEGTEAKPYTCEDVLKLKNAISDKAWVIGYILGGAKTAGNPSALVVDALTGENTAIAIADNANETDNTKMVSVQLGQSVRADVAATTSKGRQIQVQGTLESYLTVPGVKGISSSNDYKFVGDVPVQPVDVVLTDLDWDDYTSDPDERWWQIYGDGKVYGISISNGNEATTPAGTYEFDDLDPDWCYLVILASHDTIYFASGGPIVVTVDTEAKTANVKGSLVGEDGVTYNLDLSCSTVFNPYRYDEDADFTATFASYTVDTEDIENGIVYVFAQNTSNGQAVVLEAIVDPETTGVIPGTYPINDSGNEGTVAAGILDETEGLLHSFAALLNDDDEIEARWYIVSGNVTIDANLNIAVAAKNSKDRNITITLSNGTTGINNAKSAKQLFKVIENGQLIIEVDGVRYNVTGIRVK